MPVTAPPPISTNPARRLAGDIAAERALTTALPPGPTGFSLARTQRFGRDPLPLLLECQREYGPVFTVRILHMCGVFMIGPEANHYMTVSHAENFSWREGGMGDLIPLLGDGMLTIDGGYHRRARRIMLPAFHRERIAAAGETMLAEVERAIDGWRPGQRIDLYHFTRELALRIAMRALFGFDPDRHRGEVDLAAEFEHALGYYGRDYLLQILRGPGSPFARMQRARGRLDRVIHDEIARRRRTDERGEDLLSLLLDSQDEDGSMLSDSEIRDQVMTLLFAGHDTTTSTVSFLFYELARHPHVVERLQAEQDRVLAGGAPSVAALTEGMPELEMAIDETLRLYPAAWVGPRRSIEPFEFAGHRIPGGVHVHYCSWASHHLPEVFPDPEAFVPERFSPARKAALPKGAYVPFGGGSRTCIGMRFGLLEVRAIAASILQRHRLELDGGYQMSIRQMPTISPRGGLPVTVRGRELPAALAA